MGRKKRKVEAVAIPEPFVVPPPDISLSAPDIRRIPKKEKDATTSNPNTIETTPPPISTPPLCVPVNTNQPPPSQPALVQNLIPKRNNIDANEAKTEVKEESTGPKASGYAMTSHSADLISEDIYVSDGSEDEDDVENSEPLELNLTSSKMGLMRRGMGHSTMSYQPKTWVRPSENLAAREGDGNGNGNGNGEAKNEDIRVSDEEVDTLEKMDPVQRAAHILVEKQKKLEEAMDFKRKSESAENAGRDPCLFSKRTAFDIRMDQIEEKPWDRTTGGGGDISDYFNYGMAELDWVEYSEQQKIVRQELTDASRQRRNPDPTIVPIAPKTPSRQAPRVAVATTKKEEDDEDDDVEMSNVAVGPTLPTKTEVKAEENENENDSNDKEMETKDDATDVSVSDRATTSNASVSTAAVSVVTAGDRLVGGAWGAPPGSKLAKLIEEQENNVNAPPPPPTNHMMSPGPPAPPQQNQWNNQRRGDGRFHQGDDRQGGRGHQGDDRQGGRGHYYQQQNQQHGQGGYPPNNFQDEFSVPPPPNGNWHGSPDRQQQHRGGYPPNNFQQDFAAPPPPHGNWRGGRGGRGYERGGRGPPPGRGFGGRGNWRRY